MFNIEKFAKMIEVAVNKMAANEKAVPAEVIEATGTTRLHPESRRGFAECGYCDPYFGWLTPALKEAVQLLEANCSRDVAEKLWQNGWTRAFLVELFERNNEEWQLSNEGVLELCGKLEYDVTTRKGFIDWILSGKQLFGCDLPGHKSLLNTKEQLRLRNRKATKIGRMTSAITRLFGRVWTTIHRVITMLFRRNRRRPTEPTVRYYVITDAREPAVELEEDDAIVITD